MHGWTLEDVRDLDVDEYDELVQWLVDQSDRAKHGEESIDMDAISDAERAAAVKRAVHGRQ